MAFLQLGNTVETTVVCRRGGQNGVMVFHHRVDDITGVGATDAEWAALMDSQVGGQVRAMITDEARYEGVRVQVIHPVRRDAVTNTTSNGPGANVSDALPTQTAGVLSLRTGNASRSARGRKYIPFPAESDNDPTGAIGVGYLTQMETLGNAIIQPRVVGAGGDTSNLNSVIFSRKLLTGSLVTGFLRRANWGTQRRRSQINQGDAPIV